MEKALDCFLKYECQDHQMPHLLKSTNYNFLKLGMRKVKFHIKSDIVIILNVFIHICHREYGDKGRLSAQKKKMYILLTHKILFYNTRHHSQDGIQLVATHM